MGEYEEAGVEWMETRGQEEQAQAWNVVVHSRYVPVRDPSRFSAPAVGISTGRSDADSSLGSTRWPSRISRTSGVWCPAGMNRTEILFLGAGRS